MSLAAYFKQGIQKKASDVHLAAGEPPILRIDGVLRRLGKKPITGAQIGAMVKQSVEEHKWKALLETRELEFAKSFQGYRFRINVHINRGHPNLAARIIPNIIPTMEQVTIPDPVQNLINLPGGLVLVTGPAGAGKSTTLAAMVNQINQTRAEHIVTLEDPIEYVYPTSKSLVKQREVGSDTLSFEEGLRRSLRQDPNIVLVGEMRDPSTISTVLTLAETGHLVFSTLHTNSASQTIFRIVDSFTGPEQDQVRRQLSLTLRAVVAQLLVPKTDGKLMAVREVMINTPSVSSLIRQNKIEQIPSVIQTNRARGMITMKQALAELVSNGTIDQDEMKRALGTFT